MSPFEEGFRTAIAGGRRSDNPYARGWSRVAALVMPDSLSAQWDQGYVRGSAYDAGIKAVIRDFIVEEDEDNGRRW